MTGKTLAASFGVAISITIACAVAVAAETPAECDAEAESLNLYEQRILAAAEKGALKDMAGPLSCILRMQSDNEGISRYLASSYLRPFLSGDPPAVLAGDRRYQIVARNLEELVQRAPDSVRESFVSEFSRGDWRFYSLFCEQGDTGYCPEFLPDENRIQREAPLLAAASLMRLRKAYQVLKGEPRAEVARRLRKLHREIPAKAKLQRKFIDQIYDELFPKTIPVSLLG